MWLKTLFLVSILYINIIVGKEEGDSCKPSKEILDGKCILVTDCGPAIRYLRQKMIHPFTRCGFRGNIEIVCCPESSTNATPKPATENRKGPQGSGRIADQQCKKIVNNSIPPIDLHIIGGVEAALGEFPHMAALGYNVGGTYDFKCGGSLISESYILTAAHCISNVDRVKPTIARLGVAELGPNVFNPESDIEIADTIVHPKHTSTLKYHDIALLRLVRPADFSATLTPACLYTGKNEPQVAFTITGWGTIDTDKDVRSTILLKANVSSVARAPCSSNYVNWRKLPDGLTAGQLCAGDPLGRKDACQGDSGGPLQGLTADDGHYRIIGITSFGRGCGSVVPGVYTKVSEYLDWIESVVWPNGV